MTGKKKRFKIGIMKKQVEWGIGEAIEMKFWMKIRGVFDKYYE